MASNLLSKKSIKVSFESKSKVLKIFFLAKMHHFQNVYFHSEIPVEKNFFA